MPPKIFALIIGSVLLAGAATAWVISALPSAMALSVIIVILMGMKFALMRGAS